jgi:hypothetical protein
MTDHTEEPGRTPADDETCAHDWQVVNHDESREIQKCARCGTLRRV